jgi:hypothetical protein
MVKPTGASFFIFGTFAADAIDTKSPRQDIPITNSRSDKRTPRILLGPCIMCFAIVRVHIQGKRKSFFSSYPFKDAQGLKGRTGAHP